MRKIVFKIEKEICVATFLRRHGFSDSLLSELRKIPFSVNVGGKAVKMTDKIFANDIMTVSLFEEPPVFSGRIPVIYEDEDLIAVLKPCNMPTHRSKGHILGTLENEFDGVFRPLYRLDMDTEGIVFVAKNSLAVTAKNGMKKIYFAAVEGITDSSGIIDLPIAESGEAKRFISGEGKKAVTHYIKIAEYGGNSLLAFRLETGRTHQIRLHTAGIGHPVIGDKLYGNASEKYGHQLLFMGIALTENPITHKKITAKAPLPDAFADIFPDTPLFELYDSDALFAFAEGADAVFLD